MAEIDYSKRSFNYYPTNAIIYAKCIDGRWTKPVATNDFNFSLHCFAGVFHYAQSCFEGLKAFLDSWKEMLYFDSPLDNMEQITPANSSMRFFRSRSISPMCSSICAGSVA